MCLPPAMFYNHTCLCHHINHASAKKILRELTRKVHQDDPPSLPTHPSLALFQTWAITLIGATWIALLIVAPLLLVLLLFGRNYTAYWLMASVWLLGISFVTISLYLIANWIDQRFHKRQPNITALLLGIALLISTLGGAFLFWQGTNADLPPLVTVGVSALLGLIFIGWGVYRLTTDQQTTFRLRVLFLIGMLCFSASLILSGLSLKYEALGIAADLNRTIQTISRVLSPIGSVTIVLSNNRSTSQKRPQSRQVIVLLVAVIVAVLALLFMIIPHSW